MTIAAGFLLPESILLGADTMVTNGMKIYQSKIQSFRREGCSLGFVIAGSEVNATMAIESVKDKLTDSSSIYKLSGRKLVKVVQSCILEINKQYVDGRSESERFDLMVGCRSVDGMLQLLSTSGPSVPTIGETLFLP